MAKISIIMAVYNGIPYVTDAVNSILHQTYQDIEFIIVNDASTDHTYLALREFRDPRLRIIDLPQNEGQTAALNHGLRAASGAYIARQDADDVSLPERLVKQVQFLEQNPDHLLVGSAAQQINGKGEVLAVDVRADSDAAVRHEFDTGNNPYYHGSVLFRREVLDRVGYFRAGFRTSQDFDYWLRIAEHGKLANLAEPLYQYRLHEGQMTFTNYFRMKAEWQLALELAKVRAEQQDDANAYEAGIQALHDRFADFVPTRREKRRAMAEFWRGKGVSHLWSGNYPRMVYCLWRAFLYEPTNPDLWRGIRNHLPGLR